ncbi:MAG: hypothetical protein AAF928_00810 [Myxococcota bacterium]
MKHAHRIKILSSFALAMLGAAATGCSTEMGDGDYEVFRIAFDSERVDAGCYVNGEIPDSIREDSTTLKSAGTVIMYLTGPDEVYLDTGSMVLAGEPDGELAYEFEGEVVDVDIPAGSTMIDADRDGIDDFEDPSIDSDQDGLDDDEFDGFGDRVDPFVDVDGDGLDDRDQDDIVDADNDGIDDSIVEIPATYRFRTVRDYKIELFIDGDVVTGETRVAYRNVCEGTECPVSFEATTCSVDNTFSGVRIEDAQVDVALGANPGEAPAPGASAAED